MDDWPFSDSAAASIAVFGSWEAVLPWLSAQVLSDVAVSARHLIYLSLFQAAVELWMFGSRMGDYRTRCVLRSLNHRSPPATGRLSGHITRDTTALRLSQQCCHVFHAIRTHKFSGWLIQTGRWSHYSLYNSTRQNISAPLAAKQPPAPCRASKLFHDGAQSRSGLKQS